MEANQLLRVGGRKWTRVKGYNRIYFNELHDLIGLLILERDNTGNIRRIELDGRQYSNNDAKQLMKWINGANLWYDLNEGKWGWNGVSLDIAKQMISEIEAKLSGLE